MAAQVVGLTLEFPEVPVAAVFLVTAVREPVVKDFPVIPLVARILQDQAEEPARLQSLTTLIMPLLAEAGLIQ
jgi:hypothetical protein